MMLMFVWVVWLLRRCDEFVVVISFGFGGGV